MKKESIIVLTAAMIVCMSVGASGAQRFPMVKGVVFWDKNGNGVLDRRERGIPHVSVSNGKEVVQTDRRGRYALPAYDEMTVFVTKPVGYAPPLNENNVPQFFYIHQPMGSPEEIEEYRGLDPTGPLPDPLNFPLLKANESKRFKAIIMGDTQPYSHEEVTFTRDSVVKEVANAHSDAALAIAMGDNIGDVLSLYPRYLSVMKGMGMPLYLVPGNHDMNFDSPDDAHSYDTFKREFGPTYYSFNYGHVHFVVLDSVYYPSPIYSTPTSKTYHGVIDEQQMEWLENDLAFVPMHHLVVLNMHIPIVSFVDSTAQQHQVANRDELYELLAGRKVVSLAGHTHTLEHFLPGEEEEGWGQPTPIPQIIVGAACGSWWSGDLDDSGVPMAYQRGGAPKGYMIFEFNGNQYEDQYKAVGKGLSKQIHLSFATGSFRYWYDQLWTWLNDDPNTRPEK